MNSGTKISYYIVLFLAFSYIIIRGFTVGITHDEALTYKIIRGDEILKGTANHHWLNTQLSSLSTVVFGAKEFALRLPNILSFGVFWFFLFRIAKTFLKSPATQLALLLLLCGNPFILDFFSLSRGYGLSIAFLSASLFYLFKIAELKTESGSAQYYAASIFSILALSANLNTLNYFLIAQALILVCLITFKPKNQVLSLVILLILGAIPLYLSLDQLFFLKDQQELYFGTENIHTIADNLICSGFYSINGFKHAEFLRYLLYASLLFAGILMIRRKLLFTPGAFAFISLVGIIAALILEHLLFHALYPINRSALYLYPIILLAFLLNIEPLKYRFIRISIIAGSLSFILLNIPFYNFNRTMTWTEDMHIRDAMLYIKKNVKDTNLHRVECKWIYEPIINYYRLEYQIPVEEVFRENLKYEGEYLFTNPFDGENYPGSLNSYQPIFKHRGECGLFFYRRKPTSAN